MLFASRFPLLPDILIILVPQETRSDDGSGKRRRSRSGHGSDAQSASSPLFCMEAINHVVRNDRSLSPFCIQHVFSCEKDAEKRKWIANVSTLAASAVRNLEPAVTAGPGCCHSVGDGPCLFVDICDLGSPVAECAAHKKKCPVPEVDLLVIGTSCKDMSRTNPYPPKGSAVLSQQASKGGSAQTFHGMLAYLSSKCPSLCLFENVDTMDESRGSDMTNMDIFLAETSSRGYEAQICMTDAAEFGCSARRRRVSICVACPGSCQSIDWFCLAALSLNLCNFPCSAGWLPSRRALRHRSAFE